MAARIRSIVWLLVALLVASACAACGAAPAGSTTVPDNTAAPQPVTIPADATAIQSDVRLERAPKPLALLASAFVCEWLSYDSRREGPREVIQRVRSFVTPSLLRTLEESGRLATGWQPLVARRERTFFVDASVSRWATETISGGTQAVTVTGMLVTVTTWARLRTPQQVGLTLVRIGHVWRVDAVEGDGL